MRSAGERTLHACSAPGKLFVAGEYAVLWGGMARILAVGPRCSALVREREDRRVIVALAEGQLEGVATVAGVRFDTPVEPGFRYVASAIDHSLRALGREANGFDLCIQPSGQKIGIGSSARATVLAVDAVRRVSGANFDVLKLASMAHANTQGGHGSGGDVAACSTGGLVAYRRFDPTKLIEASAKGRLKEELLLAPPVDVRRLAAPLWKGVYVVTGDVTSTASAIRHLDERLQELARQEFARANDVLVKAFDEALRSSSFPELQRVLRELQWLIDSFTGIQSEAVERILALAEYHGCAGKQSGASPADGCLVFGPDSAALQAFETSVKARGLKCVAVENEVGLRAEATPHPTLAEWLAALP